MRPSEPGIRLNVGISGAGKTHKAKAEVFAAAREIPVMVIDRMMEWDGAPLPAGEVVWVENVDAAKRAIEEGARLAIIRPLSGSKGWDVVSMSEEACAWARDHRGVAGVCIPEAHRVAPNVGGKLPESIEDVACAWRHYKVALWLDTQRISLLSRTLTEQARVLSIFAVVGDRDLSVVKEIGGQELVDRVQECAAKLAAGQPGWHVELGLVRVPPFVIVRDQGMRR